MDNSLAIQLQEQIIALSGQLKKLQRALEAHQRMTTDRLDHQQQQLDDIEYGLAAQAPPVAVANLRKDLEAVKQDIYDPRKLEESVKRAERMRQNMERKKKLLEQVADMDREIAQAKAEERQ